MKSALFQHPRFPCAQYAQPKLCAQSKICPQPKICQSRNAQGNLRTDWGVGRGSDGINAASLSPIKDRHSRVGIYPNAEETKSSPGRVARLQQTPRHLAGELRLSLSTTATDAVCMSASAIAETQRRGFVLERTAIDKEKRTLSLSFSSEEPVLRGFGPEVLSHDPQAVNLSRFTTGRAPMLLNHDADKIIGVVTSAMVSNRRGKAVVRFGRTALAEDAWQNAQDGVLVNVSVGYSIDDSEAITINGQRGLRATRWTPHELSLVSIPADATVGVGRSHSGINMNQLQDDPAETRTRVLEDQQEKEQAFQMLARLAFPTEANKAQQLASRALVAGESLEAFRKRCLAAMPQAEPLGELETRRHGEGDGPKFGPLGLTEKQVKGYSMLRALRCIADPNRRARCEELEMSDQISKQFKRELPGVGFHIPDEVMTYKRDLTAGSFTGGGVLVGESQMSLIDKLRSEPICVRLGAHLVPGLVGNVTWPTLTGDSTAAFYPENGDISEGTPTFGQLAMTPKRQGALGEISQKLLVQTSGQAEDIFRQNMLTVMAVGLDAAIIDGTGADGQPLGIMRTSGINTVTFGAAPTWAKILSFETELATDNVRLDGVGWLCSPATRAKWKQVVRFTSTASPLWDDNNRVNGYPAFASNQLPSGDKCIFAKWSDVYVGQWGAPSIILDPYTKATTGLVRIIIQQWADVALAHAESAVVSTDSAAQ